MTDSTRYHGLDPSSELEQTITDDLGDALEKRGFEVQHNGTEETHAPGGLPDIEVSNDEIVVTFEPTTATASKQDREFNAIKEHLRETKQENQAKRCFSVFVSPETSNRMLNSIKDHNSQRENEGTGDMRILPLSFENLDLWVSKLIESEADYYPVSDLLSVSFQQSSFADDLRIRRLILEHIFPEDQELKDNVEQKEKEKDTQTLESLIGDLTNLENYMRESGIATAQDAIDTLIYLVFMKLYEEKQGQDGGLDRLRSEEEFREYRQAALTQEEREKGRGIHKLFDQIKEEGTFLESGMFSESDSLRDTLNDTFIIDKFIPTLEGYTFVGTGVDALGAVYEVLAKRASKDVKVGQFFTPENVVRFMIDLGDPRTDDKILDPACGTGRFLVFAMQRMLTKVNDADHIRDKEKYKRKILDSSVFGADIDDRIAKIAKMNMWVHGDGKSNILGGSEYNGLTLHKQDFDNDDSFDGQFDIVLANPPLGKLNYNSISFVEEYEGEQERISKTLNRMPILPTKNLTEKTLKDKKDNLQGYKNDISELENKIGRLEKEAISKTGQEIDELEPEQRENITKEILKGEKRKEYGKNYGKLRRKRTTVERNEDRIERLKTKIRSGQPEIEITGSKMKGGALFLPAMWNYLKGNAYPDKPPERRGGKLLVILDEGILNTDRYLKTRNFMKRRFYIKAIISLTPDTFMPVSNTDTKTSIVYANKKMDFDAKQKEPIFFGHVENVGLDTKGNAAPNDLPKILREYNNFESAVLDAYDNNEIFRPDQFSYSGW